MRPRATFSNAISLLALFIALGGSAYAVSNLGRGDVKSKHIARDAVKSKHVGPDKLKGSDVKESSLAIPTAYARVSPDGTIAQAKGLRQADVTKTGGAGGYCFDVEARHAQATAGFRDDAVGPVDTIFVLDDALADAAFPGGSPGIVDNGCAAADDFYVGAGTPPSSPNDTSFWIVFF